MSNIIPFKHPETIIFEHPPCQAFAPRRQPPRLYNVYKGKELAYGCCTLGQAMRFVALAVQDESGIVLVAEAMRLGYHIKAIR